MKKTVHYLLEKKKNGQKITMLTCYDYPTAVMMEAAGVDILIVGDSVGTNVLGYPDETHVTMADMLHHLKAVQRANQECFILADLPYRSYETTAQALENSRRFVAAGADAVKFEGRREDIVRCLTAQGIAVVCHIGLNPQHHQDDMKQGKIVHGKRYAEAIALIEAAASLQQAGAHMFILEKIPELVARLITANCPVPTIGIGSGRYCDGQVLIVHDMIGFSQRTFRHVKQYADVNALLLDACRRYIADVTAGVFPEQSHANAIQDEELRQIVAWAQDKGLQV